MTFKLEISKLELKCWNEKQLKLETSKQGVQSWKKYVKYFSLLVAAKTGGSERDSMFNDISLWRFILNRYLGFRYKYFGLQILNQAIVSGARHNSSHLQNAILKVRPKTTYLFAFWLWADQNLTFKMYLTPLSFDVIVAV